MEVVNLILITDNIKNLYISYNQCFLPYSHGKISKKTNIYVHSTPLNFMIY